MVGSAEESAPYLAMRASWRMERACVRGSQSLAYFLEAGGDTVLTLNVDAIRRVSSSNCSILVTPPCA